MAVLQSLISPWKKEGKKREKKNITTPGIRNRSPIQVLTAEQGLINFVEQAKHVPCGIVTLLYAERVFLNF